MRLRLPNWQELDLKAPKIKAKDLERYKKIDEVLHHQKFFFVPEIIKKQSLSAGNTITIW